MTNFRDHGVVDVDVLVGLRIKHRRNELGMKQETLADIIDVGQSSLADYEGGKISLRLPTLLKLGKALKVPVSYFVVGHEDYTTCDLEQLVGSKPIHPADIKNNLVAEAFTNRRHYDVVTRFVGIFAST